MHQQSTTTAATAEALTAQLQQEGFRPGCPAGLPLEAQRIDRHICRRLKCPRCRKRGCTWKPFTDGRSYRVLAVCGRCSAAEEM